MRKNPLGFLDSLEIKPPKWTCFECGAVLGYNGSVSGLCGRCVKAGSRQLESDAFVLSKLGLTDAPKALIDTKREQLLLRQLTDELKQEINRRK